MSEQEAKPRFWDAHTHLSAGAADLLDLDLRSARTAADITASLAAAAREVPPGQWIRAWGWDGTTSPEDVAPGHPVLLARRDGHGAWLSPAARSVLGLPQDREILDEEAFDAVRANVTPRSSGERLSALRPRLCELVDAGVAATDDMVEPWGPEIFARLRDRGELPVSIGMWLPERTEESEAEAVRRAFPAKDVLLATRGIKIFLDGSLSARTAALSRPYADDSGNEGQLRMPAHELQERVERWASRGWPVAIHAIGDRAVSLALSALERAPAPPSGSHRIEHAQVVLRSDLPRFSRAGVVASVQPGHWRDDRGWLASRLGERPDVVVHPLRSFARFAIPTVFGSDWPVSDWHPAVILGAAVDQQRGEEALDPAEAMAWYTSQPR